MARANRRAKIGLGEDRDVEGIVDPAVTRLGSDQIAVVEHLCAAILEGQHGPDMIDDRGPACRHQLALPVLAQALHLIKTHAARHIAINKVMGEVWSVTISGVMPRRTISG